MKEYTVLLLYPDFVADEFGKETYLAWVYAQNPEDAVISAQAEACHPWDGPPENYDPEEGADFYPLLVVEGRHQDITPDRWR